MNPIDFSIVPRSTMQANNNALFASQRALGDEFENAIGDVAKTMKQEQEAKAKAKALEIEARGLEDWDNPQGMFANSINDNEKKARKLASLIAPFDELLASKWINQADVYATHKRRAGELEDERTSRTNLKNLEIEAGLEKDRAGEIKRKEESEAKQRELDTKTDREGLELSPTIVNTALLKINAGPDSYRRFFDMAQANKIQGFQVLPSPNDTPNDIISQLTAYGKGQVEASTIGADIESVNVGLKKDKFDLPVAELEAEKAEKDLAYETSSSKESEIPPEIRTVINEYRGKYKSELSKLDKINKNILLLSEILKKDRVNSYDAIAAIVIFNKLIDPDSIVKEAEFAIAQQANGVIDGLNSKTSGFVNGINLTDEGKTALSSFVNLVKTGYEKDVISLNAYAQGLANHYKVPVEAITMKYNPSTTKVEQKQNAIVESSQGFGE